MEEKAIATKATCNRGGLEITSIGTNVFLEEVVMVRENYDGVPTKSRMHKLYTNAKGEAYFKYKGTRQYLNTFMKVGI